MQTSKGEKRALLLLGGVALRLSVLTALAFAPTVSLQGQAAPDAAQPAAPAPQDDLAKAYQEGLQAFSSGNFEGAVTSMQLIIEKATPESPLQTVYYTLGASEFNLQHFDRAIEALRKYLEKYPQGTQASDAAFFIAQAQIQLKDFAGAVQTVTPLENKPEYREKALLLIGDAQKESGNWDAAIAALTKLTSGGIRTANQANGALLLASVYAQKGEPEKAIDLLKSIRQNPALLDNVIRLNAMAIEQGDTLLKQDRAEDALLSYQLVQSRDEVIRLQTERIAAMNREIEANLVALRADPQRALELTTANERIRKAIAQTKEQLAAFEKTPDFEGPFWMRVAQAYYGMDKKWEAIAIYDELLRRQPNRPEREAALFGLVVTSAEANRADKTRELAKQYLKEFPAGANAGTVGYLLGATALQGGDVEGAAQFFGQMLASPTQSAYREEISFLLGNAHFSLGEFDKASGDYAKYIETYPSGKHVEEATYRAALCALFAGKYDEATKQIQAYIAAHPTGQFVDDGKYRLAVCKYAASEYEAVIADCDAWIKEFPGNPLLGEVYALKADALAGLEGHETEAIDAYIESLQVAGTEEVLNHSLTEGATLMQRRGDWEKIGTVLQKFVAEHPDSPIVVGASYWIAKAKAKEGKADEARQIIADVVKKNIKNPEEPAVEQLLTQLAQLSARRRPAASPDPSATPVPVAEANAAAAKELDALLGGDKATSVTEKARILFAKSELARLRRDPAEQEKDLAAIAEFPPQKLSPLLLAQAGDYLLNKGQSDKAATFFKELMDNYPKSDYLDFAYNGFGEIAYAKKDYPAALASFTDAIDKGGAILKLKDVTVGQAKTLLAMGRLDEAKKLFEQIASTREWRGDATAYSIYSLGEIEEKKGKLPEAIAFYQRVYVAYGRFLPWVAKSYIRSAECFERLGKKEEAANTYREMLRNEKLAGFPEYAEARKKLEGMGTP